MNKITSLILTALLSPLAALHTNHTLPEISSCGKLRVGFF